MIKSQNIVPNVSSLFNFAQPMANNYTTGMHIYKAKAKPSYITALYHFLIGASTWKLYCVVKYILGYKY